MGSKAKVSVIIPAYNRSDYIDQTITCVLEQTYPNIELIVVDDGSTDGTYEKAKSYGDKLILLTHADHANRGQSAAINLALKKATGKYIAVLDSDDYWELNKIDIQVGFLEENENVGLVYTNGYAVDADGNVQYPIHREHHEEPNDANAVLLDCYIALPVNSLVRKEVYDQVGEFDETYRAAQDHDMLIRIAEVTAFAYLPDFLWYYRRHENSISSKQQDIRWRYGFSILQKAKQRFPYRPSTIRKRLAVLNYRMGKCRMAEKRVIPMLWFMGKAFALDPVRAIKILLHIERRN